VVGRGMGCRSNLGPIGSRPGHERAQSDSKDVTGHRPWPTIRAALRPQGRFFRSTSLSLELGSANELEAVGAVSARVDSLY
jgi:hypothetical protein